MSAILDSNFLFALRSERDKNFQRAYEINSKIEQEKKKCMTSLFVANEVFNLSIFRTRGNVSNLEKYVSLFFGNDNFFKIYHFSEQELILISDILRKYLTPKRLLSFTDASLIYLYQKFNADYIVSFDRHFDHILNRDF